MQEHEAYIRECYALALEAARAGNHPFGALLVRQGEIVLRAANTVNTARDISRHAELNLVVEAVRALPEDVLAECTLFTSTAPCVMCAGAIREAGIRRVVFGVSYQRFVEVFAHNYRYLAIDEIFRRLDAPLEFTGPVLEDEGVTVYQYWP